MLRKYLLGNCGLLLLPVFLWNILLYQHLPEAFQTRVWNNVPAYVSGVEFAGRVVLFTIPFFFLIGRTQKNHKRILYLFIAGLLLYFLSWLLLVLSPDTSWSNSILGQTAPAWSAGLWIIPLGFLFHAESPVRKFIQVLWFVSASIFLFFHTYHALLIFAK